MRTRVRWVVQSTLGNSNDHLKIAEECSRIKAECLLYPREPFSKELPDTPTNIPTIFYGSTRFVNLCHRTKRWNPGAFFDPFYFTVKCWMTHYGERCLNHGASLTTLAQLVHEPYDPDRLFFIRPDKDLKEFTGSVWSFNEVKRWTTGLLKTDLGDEQLSHIDIWISEPWKITREWRTFIVNNKVCQASQYKKDGKLKESADVPQEVIQYAEETSLIWQPHNIFVLDVCESAGNLFILEIGCVNSAGFYSCDIGTIVSTITEAVEQDVKRNQETMEDKSRPSPASPS